MVAVGVGLVETVVLPVGLALLLQEALTVLEAELVMLPDKVLLPLIVVELLLLHVGEIEELGVALPVLLPVLLPVPEPELL